MQKIAPEEFPTLEEANAEVRRLRLVVAALERELADARHRASTGNLSQWATDSPLFSRLAPDAEEPQDAPERLAIEPDRSPDTVTSSIGAHVDEGSGGSRTPPTRTPIMEVLTGNEDVANRHLEDLRAAITRLREEREQASAELLNLTRGEVPGAQKREPLPAKATQPATRTASPPLEVVQPVAAASVAPPTHIDAPTASSEPASHPREPEPPASEPVAPVGLEKSEGAGRPEPPAITFKDLFIDDEVTAGASKARRRGPLVALTALVALAVGGYVAWWASSRMPDRAEPNAAAPAMEAPLQSIPDVPAAREAAESTPTNVDPEEPAPPAASADPSPAAASPAPPSGRIQLALARECWMRITVDGRQVVEGLVEGNQTLSFDPTGVLVIRAGDAGAVTVTIDGESKGVLGRDGAVVTRAFELPASISSRP